MAKKKKSNSESEDSPIQKGKSLWDHVSHIKKVQDPNYFKTLSDTDKTSFNVYMILRALSYTTEYLDIVNELNIRYHLSPEMTYRVLIDILPKQDTYDKFIKWKNEDKYSDWLVELVRNHFCVSTSDTYEFLEIFLMSDGGKEELKNLCSMYGIEDKQIKSEIK